MSESVSQKVGKMGADAIREALSTHTCERTGSHPFNVETGICAFCGATRETAQFKPYSYGLNHQPKQNQNP